MKKLPFRTISFESLKFQKKVEKLLRNGVKLEYRLKESSKTLDLHLSAFHHFLCAWEFNRDRINFPGFFSMADKAAFCFFRSDQLELTLDGKKYDFSLDSKIFGSYALDDLIHKNQKENFVGEKQFLEIKLISDKEQRDPFMSLSLTDQYEKVVSLLKKEFVMEFSKKSINVSLLSERLKLFNIDVIPDEIMEKKEFILNQLKTQSYSWSFLDIGEVQILSKNFFESSYNEDLLEKVRVEFLKEKKSQEEFLNFFSKG